MSRRFRISLKKLYNSRQLLVILLPAAVYYFIFCYIPMAGVQVAFREYSARLGIWHSPWIGFQFFERFFASSQFYTLMYNTLSITLSSLLFTFPVPILLAIVFNECRYDRFKKTVQTITYAPHFISTVVFVSMITIFLSPGTGIINTIIKWFGGEAKDFLGDANLFVAILLVSAVWQNCGWNAIIYVAALSGVDPQLHEAAMIDGANRIQRIWHIDLTGILPTIITLLILQCGQLLNVGYEKVYLLQNSMNISRSEVISTYVYKIGLLKAQYSYTAAIGLFNSVVNIILLILTNRIVKVAGEEGLF